MDLEVLVSFGHLSLMLPGFRVLSFGLQGTARCDAFRGAGLRQFRIRVADSGGGGGASS